MKRILMNDVMAPIDAFDLFPKKRFDFHRWLKALFRRNPGAKVTYARAAVAKY